MLLWLLLHVVCGSSKTPASFGQSYSRSVCLYLTRRVLLRSCRMQTDISVFLGEIRGSGTPQASNLAETSAQGEKKMGIKFRSGENMCAHESHQMLPTDVRFSTR